MNPLNTIFKFLTPEDISLLEKIINIENCEPESRLISEGEKTQKLFIILEGSARIEKNYLGTPIPFFEMQSNEIFGEMSFISENSASATVICNSFAKVGSITLTQLQPLLDANPEFASRFYRSIAYILSARLKENTDQQIANIFSPG